MTRDELIDKTTEHYSKLILSQYQTQKNIAFLKSIMSLILEYDPLNFDSYFNLSSATGDHLTEIAYTLCGIKRSFDGITLSDQDLMALCLYSIIKRNIKILSMEKIQEVIKSTFGNNMYVKCEPENITYFVNEDLLSSDVLQGLIKFGLLPQPLNAILTIIKFNQYQKVFALMNSPFYIDNDIYGSWVQDGSGSEQGIFYAELTNIIKII